MVEPNILSQPRPIIGVMGPGEGARITDLDRAYALGKRIGQEDWILLTGGRRAGVMEAVSRGAKQAGGITLGILPQDTSKGMSLYVDIPICTGVGFGRNNINVLSSDVVVACGMGLGTASEVCLALKNQRPVILLGVDSTSQMFFRQFTTTGLHISREVDEAIAIIKRLLR